MHVEHKIIPVDTASGASYEATASQKRSTKRTPDAASAYRKPSIVKLNPSPLRRLAWVFGLR